MNARIETTRNGAKRLYVYYTADRWDEAISEALEAYNLTRQQVQVVALPLGSIGKRILPNHQPG